MDGNATFGAGESGTLGWGDGVVKNDWGEISVCVGPGDFSRASLRAFIFSARWTSARIAGSGVAVRDTRREMRIDDPVTFVR